MLKAKGNNPLLARFGGVFPQVAKLLVSGHVRDLDSSAG